MVDVYREVLERTLNEGRSTCAQACVICLDTISGPPTLLPCKHNDFDYLCLLSWLQEQSSCPLCKANACAVECDRNSAQRVKIYHIPTHKSSSQPVTYNRAQPHRISVRRNAWSQEPGLQCLPGPDGALFRRRHVYRNQLYSLHVGSSRLSDYRDLTPQLFVRDETLLLRACNWIRRELQVFDFLIAHGEREDCRSRGTSSAEFLLEYIVAILKTTNIKGSGGAAEDLLQEFLGREDTSLFLHELQAWLRSPYTKLSDWDRQVQYGKAAGVAAQPKRTRTTGGTQSMLPLSRKRRRQSVTGRDRDCYVPS